MVQVVQVVQAAAPRARQREWNSWSTRPGWWTWKALLLTQRRVAAVDCLARHPRCAVTGHWTGLQASTSEPRHAWSRPWRVVGGQTDLVQETGPGTARKPLTSRRGRSPGRIAREKARQVGISRQHEQAHGRIHAKVDSSGPQKQRDEGSGTGGWMQPMAKPGNVSRCDGAEGGVWGETVKKEAVVEGIGRWRGRDRLAVVWV